MFKTHENQVIAVFIEDRIYTCLQANFPIQAFRHFLYGYFNPEFDGELYVKYYGKELDPDKTIIDLSDGEKYSLEVTFKKTEPSGEEVISIKEEIELFTLNVLQP